MFIKLFYGINDTEYELRTFDTNITCRMLAKSLEIENNLNIEQRDSYLAHHVRLWFRFYRIKGVYGPIQTKNIEITDDMINALHIDPLKWHELPDDYAYNYLSYIIDVDTDKVLQIGVDFYDKSKQRFATFDPSDTKSSLHDHVGLTRYNLVIL